MEEVEGKQGKRRENPKASSFGTGLDALAGIGDANTEALDKLNLEETHEIPTDDTKTEEPDNTKAEEGVQPEKEEVEPEPEKKPEPPKEEPKASLDDEFDIPNLDSDIDEPDEDKPEKAEPAEDDEKTEELLKDPHLNDKTRERIEHFRARVKELEDKLAQKPDDTRVQELQARVQELEAAPKADPIADTEREELIQLRRRYALEKDDTLKKEFDEPIQQTNDWLTRVVDKTLNEEQAAQIKKMGFRRFAETLPQAFKEFVQLLEENSPSDASLVRSRYADLVRLEEGKKSKVEELTKGANEWFEQQEAAQKQTVEEQQKQIEEYRKAYTNFANELKAKDPAFALEDTSKLSGEAKSRAETRNAQKRLYQADLDAILKAANLDDYKKVVYRAALVRPTVDKLKQAVAENKALKEELAKIKKARDPKPNPAHKGGETKPKQSTPKSFAAAIDEYVKQGG